MQTQLVSNDLYVLALNGELGNIASILDLPE